MAEPNGAAEYDTAVQRANELLAASGNALVPLGGAAPEVYRAAVGSQLADATRAAQTLKAAATAREAELRAALNRQLAELRATMEPLNALVKKLQENVWTINLYLGRDEQIQQIADGEPAPADAPITLRQLVLAMDEECLVAADSGGIDARQIDAFAAWLTANPAHLHQVMPEPKGVVVLAPSRQRRDYGDQWMNVQMGIANAESHWLIRNGERVYLMTTDLDVGDLMLPKRDEFMSFFYEVEDWGPNRGERRPLEPGGEEWVKAEERADSRRRHYMRIMLVLQGLADRSTVFQPLASPVNFLSLTAQDNGQVRIINEVDGVLTTGRPPFRTWLTELNRKLTPGMRIIGAFNATSWYNANDNERSSGGRHSRLRPENAGPPKSLVIHTIKGRSAEGGLVFTYDRMDTIDDTDQWGRYRGQRAPKTRASCTIYPRDDFIIPIDLVTVDELQAYLHGRVDRHEYLAMIPLVQAAITVKHAEEAAEAPFRRMLAGMIAQANGLDVATIEADMPDLVRWWKLANRWQRPLVADQDSEAKAVDAILTEWHARRRAAERGGRIAHWEQGIVAHMQREMPDAICIARRRGGQYSAFAPAGAGENIWLNERRYAAKPRGDYWLVGVCDWTQVSGRTLATLDVLWHTERWDGWDHRASRSEHLTGPERDTIVDQLRTALAGWGTPIAATYESKTSYGDLAKRFTMFGWADTPRSPHRDRDDDDPGALMVSTSATWRRDRTGKVQLDMESTRYRPNWGRFIQPGNQRELPWRDSTSPWQEVVPVWSDPEQMAKVDTVWQKIEERAAAEKAVRERVWKICGDLETRWKAEEEKRRYARFLEDHGGATDLWEAHRKILTIVYTPPTNISSAISKMVRAGTGLTGVTVAQAIEAAGMSIGTKVSAGLADMPLIQPDASGE